MRKSKCETEISVYSGLSLSFEFFKNNYKSVGKIWLHFKTFENVIVLISCFKFHF